MHITLRILALLSLFVASSAHALSLGELLGAISTAEAGRSAARTSCEAISYGSVPGEHGGSASIAMYPCLSSSSETAFTMVVDVTFASFSTVPGFSSTGTVRVEVITDSPDQNHMTMVYRINSIGGPTVYDVNGSGHTVEFLAYTMTASLSNDQTPTVSFSGGANVDGQFWAAGADNWGYVWGS